MRRTRTLPPVTRTAAWEASAALAHEGPALGERASSSGPPLLPRLVNRLQDGRDREAVASTPGGGPVDCAALRELHLRGHDAVNEAELDASRTAPPSKRRAERSRLFPLAIGQGVREIRPNEQGSQRVVAAAPATTITSRPTDVAASPSDATPMASPESRIVASSSSNRTLAHDGPALGESSRRAQMARGRSTCRSRLKAVLAESGGDAPRQRFWPARHETVADRARGRALGRAAGVLRVACEPGSPRRLTARSAEPGAAAVVDGRADGLSAAQRAAGE
jgi:hypothetical protein